MLQNVFLNLWREEAMSKEHYIIPIFVPNEGCPHNCVFCDQSTITGCHEIAVDYDYTIKTIESYIKTIKNKNAVIEVSFFGGTFTAIDINKQKELLKAAKYYKDKGYIDFIRLSTRPDYIDKDILDNLKDYETDIIELGIQSFDEDVLKKSGRGHTGEDSARASVLIKEYGFVLGHQIMLGLPGDNFEKDIATCVRSISLKPDICRIYPALVIKNTPMERMYKDGIYKPYSLEDAVNVSKILYGLYDLSGINVIRIGLQPTEEINVGSEVCAGPFHPSFRELVESSLMNEMIEDAAPKDYAHNIHIFVNSKDLSKLYSNKKQYYNKMTDTFKNTDFSVSCDNSLKRGNLLVMYKDDIVTELSLHKYVTQKYKKFIK